ncbi:hypothetical protein LEM8419_03521 [Neolewinella maritima]|uniref:NinB protein n=1 Tax=Neolewinella maritima TaxID=1383882 RepID=A0ABM9B600_9BACT|nr:hypothetical protein [Neolewinella maritima]CAH1002649.1 hypothetical protein LEM8419_03521 [Neolewinella maritima]
MPTTLTYTGKVTNGLIDLPKRLRKEVHANFEGKRICVTFKAEKRQRSSQQNRYYWSVVIPYVLDGFIDLGNDLQSSNAEHQEWVHHAMKRLHLSNGIEVADMNGELVTLPPSTKRLSTVEMMEYIDCIVRWAKDCLDVTIPEANEQGAFAFLEA